MSKKKGKPAARKAPMKATNRKPAKKSAPKSRPGARLTAGESSRTLIATIFLFRTGNGNKIRTSPQRLYANPGDHVEFNVVNMIDGTDVPVTISFPDGGPWGKEPFQIRSFERKALTEAVEGRFKYTVSAFDAQEDPEVELPDGN